MKEPAWLGLALAIGMGLMVGSVSVRRPSSSHTQDSEPFFSVAMIGMDREAHVKQLLAAHGIPFAVWGSGHGGYWVEVPVSQALRAIEVLRADAKTLHYYVHFSDRHPQALSEGKWLEHPVDLPYADLLSRPEFAASTALGTCLRHPDVATVARTFSKISQIRYLRYLLSEAARDRVEVEEVWLVNFPAAVGGKRRSAGFQIMGSGASVHLIKDTESSDY